MVAEKLIPKDHGFGVQRVPMETRYYEAYNRRQRPPRRHQRDADRADHARPGIRTTERDYEFDIIVYATGFDAITGAYDRIDIRGVGGQKLRDKWRDGPVTYLGMQVHGFPNMLMPAGPQSGSASTNYPRGIEIGVNWCIDLLEYMWKHGYVREEADAEAAEKRWTAHVAKHVRHDADAQGQALVHRLQLQRRGPRAGHHPLSRLQRRHAEVRGRRSTTVADKGYEGVVLSADRAAPPAGSQPAAVA